MESSSDQREVVPFSGSVVRSLAAWAVLAGVMAGFLWLRFAMGRDMAHDFTAFYIAGRIPPASLYDHDAYGAFGEHLLGPLGITYYPPYVRPAVFALPLRVIAWMPYWPAFKIWLLIQYAGYLLVLGFLCRIFRTSVWLLPLFGLFYPAVAGPTIGQDAIVMPAIILLSMALLLRGKDSAAGAVLALGLCKFSLIAFFPLILLLHGKRRAFTSFGIAAAVLAFASALLNSPRSYLELLSHVREYIGVPVEAQYGLRGVAAQIGAPWLFFVAAAVLTVVTAIAIRRLPVKEAFAVASIAAVMFAYKAEWYDASLLVLPLSAALARRSIPGFVCASFLLLFPGWSQFPTFTLIPLAGLYAGAIMPAFKYRRGIRVEVMPLALATSGKSQ